MMENHLYVCTGRTMHRWKWRHQLDKAMGLIVLNGPKRFNYVLNKMPRDCTDPPSLLGTFDEQSSCVAVSHTNMPNKIKTKNNNPYPRLRRNRKNGNGNGNDKVRTVYVQKEASKPKVPRSFLGKVLDSGNAIATIFGLGAYSVKKNSLWDGTLARQVPHMQSNMESVVFRHREYIGDISSSIAFAENHFHVNPGLDDAFPYLSAIARNFQQYRFKGLIFEFKSTSANALNSTNTALGTVALAMQYQTDADDFISKGQMLNEMWSVDGKPSENVILPIECDPSMTTLPLQYVRDGELSANKDLKMYDIGKMTIATVGSQAAAVIGELWVSYEIELCKPQARTQLAYAGECAHYSLLPLNSQPLNGSAVYQDNIGLVIAGTGIMFPKSARGKYLIHYNVVGTAVVSAVPVPSGVNMTLAYDWQIHTENVMVAPDNGATTESVSLTIVVDVTTEQIVSYLNLSTGGTLPATSPKGDLVVVQVPENFD